MNQVNSNTPMRRWWQGWFVDWRLAKRDQRNYTKATVLTVSLMGLYMLAGVNLKAAPESYLTIPLWLWILAMSPLVLLPFVIQAWRRFLNETEELFYQLEGNITVVVQDEGVRREMKLGPGDMYLHPAKVPHSPVREANSIGLVVERKRVELPGKDGLLWFCDNCNHKLHEVYFPLHDVEKDFLSHFEDYYNNEELRTCDNCGTVMETDPRFMAQN